MYKDLAKRRAVSKHDGTGHRAGVRRKLFLRRCLVAAGVIIASVLCVMALKDAGNPAADEVASVSNPQDRKGQPVESAGGKSEPKHPVLANGEYGPKIKGLRLGMEYDDVNAVVKRLCDQHNAEHPKYSLFVDYGEENSIVLRSVVKNTGNFCQFFFEEGKLISYGLEGEVLQVAFGVSPDNVSDEQLLQMFLDNYGIPSVKTQAFTHTNPSRFGAFGGVETLGYYDGSENGGYAFEFRGYRGTGNARGSQKWSFSVYRYFGLDFGLPGQISAEDVRKYETGIGPVIKGFQLGMKRAEVLALTKMIWPDAKPIENGNRISFHNSGPWDDLDFKFQNGKVCKFNISGDLFAVLFHARPQYQLLKDFAKGAIEYYHIPEVEGKSKSAAGTIATCYDCTMNGFQFWVEETRRANETIWAIGCSHTDTSKFD